MSEVNIQNGIATWLRAMAEFADADVVINDWSVLDGEAINAPYVIISNADTFRSRQDVTTPQTSWEIVVTLCEFFTKWDTTLNNFRTRRQAILDTANAVGTARSAGGLAGTSINEIRSEGGIIPYNPIYNRDGYNAEVLPRYLIQHMLFTVEEY